MELLEGLRLDSVEPMEMDMVDYSELLRPKIVENSELEVIMGTEEDENESFEPLEVVTAAELEIDLIDIVAELVVVTFQAGRVTVLLKS